jgi:3-oxoacyl-[acyl-carrier protein] reductase
MAVTTSVGKTILVTGASRGIGYQIARRFAGERDDYGTVLLLARPSDAFSAAAADLAAAARPGVRVLPYAVDLADADALRSVVDAVHAEHHRIDTLINNAGYANPVALQQIDFADFQYTVNVNVYAPFLLVQQLLHQGNTFELIVNVASTAGINGRAGWLTYSASKAAMITMSQVMREELALYGTRVVCVSPGRCATDLRKALAPDEDPETIMRPADVAAVVDMLASGVGRFVDSANLVVRQ